jgi:hypothetical protein
LDLRGAGDGVDDAGELDQTRAPSPINFTVRPLCRAIVGSISS